MPLIKGHGAKGDKGDIGLTGVKGDKGDTGLSGGLSIPTIIKTVASTNDKFIGIDETGTPYIITKANLFAGLSSSGTTLPPVTQIPSDAITGFDGTKEFIIEIGNGYLSY